MPARGLLAAALLCCAGAVPARAQVMDYGGLEAMFGEPVTLSATGSPQKAADVPVDMEIITADDIRRSGATSIPDVLSTVAGVDVRRYGAFDADVAIRGYNAANSPRVLVLLNGRQIYVDYFGYTAWGTLPVQLEEIRQIEVIKGPNSALYGFNAVGGVINIVTYDPLFDNVTEAAARAGTRGEQQLSGVGTLKIGDRAGLMLSAGEEGEHELSASQLPASIGPYPSHAFSRSLYAHGHANLDNGLDVTAEADGGESRELEMAIGGWPAWTAYAWDREKLGIGRESPIGYLSANVYRNYMRYTYLAGYNCLVCTGIDNSLVVAQFSDLMKVSASHTLRLGLEYRNNQAGGSIFRGTTLGFDLFAADAMWNWQVTPKLALTNSFRFDNMATHFDGIVDPRLRYGTADYSRTFNEPSFNSAAVYKVSDRDTVRGSVARAVQIPSYYELFPQPVDIFQNPSLQGNPRLDPSILMNYEVDYVRALPEIRSKGQLALYHQDTSKVLALPGDGGAAALTIGSNNVAYAANIGSSSATGAELTVSGADSDGWRWKASYAAEFIRDHLSVNADQSNPESSVDNQRGTPRHIINLALGRSWDRWEADVNAHWQSSYDDIVVLSNNATGLTKPGVRVSVSDYLALGARVGYDVNEHLRLAVSGQQLNRSTLAETGGSPTERRVLGTITVRY